MEGDLQALLGAPMAACSGCGERDGGIGHGKRRSRTGLARVGGDVQLAGWRASCRRVVKLGVESLAAVLENIRPRPADGANRLENRALLCRPCSLEKSGRRTLAALQSANRRGGRLGSGNHPIDLKLAAKQCLAGLE